MAENMRDGFVLESEWTPPRDGAPGRCRLTLTNGRPEPLRNFRLGVSGPGRLGGNAEFHNARLVRTLSNYCEFEPEPGFELAPGARWSIEITTPDNRIRHWTEGPTAGFVIHADGGASAALTVPTRLSASNEPNRRATMRLAAGQANEPGLSIIPWPQTVSVAGRRSAPPGFAIVADDGAGDVVADNFAALTQFLFPGEGIVRDDEEGGYPVDCSFDEALGEQAYRIDFSPDGADVVGGSETGLLYGLVTLAQMQRGARLEPTRFSFPTRGRIEDRPRMRWRGCHLDVARRFYSSEEIKQFLCILAWNKLNVFHWHLSDDEAWRVEVNAYPALTGRAAWRGHGEAIPPLLGSGPERTGGHYTQDAVRDIVDLAQDFGIEVVPEIDIPGHCYALLQALPELVDLDESGQYGSIQHFPNNCLNPAVEAVYHTLEAIFGELCELFPSRYFHVGADEVPADAWHGSPLANRLRADLGVAGAAPLQAHLLKRVQSFLASRGKITGAWEEAAEGGGIEKNGAYLVGWKDAAISRRLAAEGYDVVAAPAQAYYLDMANSADWHEPGAAWAGWISPERTYAFDPTAGWSEAERERLLGIQGCIWSEHLTDRAVFDRLVFPRLSALAETAWTPEASKDWDRFSALAGLMPNLYGQFEGR